MKKILLCAATELELQPIKKNRQHIRDHQVEFFVYGVGIPLSLYYLNQFLQDKHFDAIISVGIAGSFISSIDLGSVVAVKQDCFGDMGAFQQDNKTFSSLFEMGWINPNQSPFMNEQLVNPFLSHFNLSSYRTANAITVQQMSSDGNRIHILKNKYAAEVESMEGACIHFIALEKQIPFLQLRAISNFVGETDKTKWTIPLALNNLTTSVQHILQQN